MPVCFIGGMKTKLIRVAQRTAFAMTIVAATPPAIAASPTVSATRAPEVRLYTLDCGTLAIDDMGMFSDTGEHAGEKGRLAVPCYLVKHGSDWLLWDTGLGDRLAALPDGERKLGGHWTVRRTLSSQLAALGLKPGDIRYVALSHTHADHSGNIALFPRATWLLSPTELAWARGRPTPLGVDATLIAGLAKVRIEPVADDRDVFGDGTVRILRAPGHTPGHKLLVVDLPRSGTVLLSGDLFHSRENYEKSLVPPVNVSRADTLASFDRFARLVRNTHARVVIQHAPEDFAAMPAFPKFLD